MHRPHFSTDPDARLDFWQVIGWISAVLIVGAMANVVAAARMALS